MDQLTSEPAAGEQIGRREAVGPPALEERDAGRGSRAGLVPIAMADQPPGTEVWAASLTEIFGSIDPASCLSPEEEARALSFRQFGDRERFTGGRALLRHALSVAVDGAIAPSAWQFREGPNGKPVMDHGLPAIPFNLSHSGACVAVAIGEHRPVGIDVESTSPRDRGDVVVDVLSDREHALLNRMEHEQQQLTFVRLWTVKEAVAKAFGLGALLDFRAIAVELDPLSVSMTHAFPGLSEARLDVASATVECGAKSHYLSVAKLNYIALQ